MFQKIIGLDVGSFSIKAVLVQRGLKGPYIEKCIEWPIASPQADGDWVAALHKAGIRSPSGRELVVASVPQRSVFTHMVRLPFTDPQQVAQTVAYEMEGQIPLDLEEVVVDYHPVQSSPDKPDSTLLAIAIPREHLKRQLEELQKAGLDPKALEIAGLALFNFSQHYFKDVKGDIALLDIGASKTSVCIVGEENPRLVRTIWWGGHHLTQAIAQVQNLSLEQAEQEKRNAVVSDASTDEEGISRTLKAALEPLIKELNTTFHVYEIESRREIQQIYVCGGTARLRGLPSYLAYQLGKELVKGPGVPNQETFTIGIGLALKECLGQRGSRVRFRSGEFAYHKEQTQTRQRLVALGVAGAILLLLAGSNLYLRYDLKSSRYQEIRSHVRSIFQQTFPNVKTIVNEVEQTKAAQKEIEKKAAFFGNGTVTVLDLIGELTRRMPKDRVIEVSDLLIEQASIRMEAQTESFDSVEKFKEALEKYERFREVTISDAKMSADQSKVRFRIHITLTEGI
jgi:general secretion pathway protein L